MDLSKAISKHAEWKVKFRSAITTHEKLDAAAIARDNCCDLGKWLHGDARGKHAALASYRGCVDKHAAFHVQAGRLAQLINAEKYTEAEAMMGSETPYARASSEVGVAILQLKKEAGL